MLGMKASWQVDHVCFPMQLLVWLTFLKQEVEVLERIAINVFRVGVRGKEYCLQTAVYLIDAGMDKEVKKLHELNGAQKHA